MNGLRKKVIVVTGGGSGIGEEICYRLAMEGASVVVADIDLKKAKVVEKNIISRGGKSIAVGADVTSEESAKRMAQVTIKRFKKINVLVNNVGIYPLHSWEKISVEEWDKVMIVNLRTIFVCSKAVFGYMKKQKKGKIINISSSTFWLGSKGLLPYVASKGGVIGFTRALAREVGDFGITVNAVTAGLTMTQKAKEIFGQERIEQVIQQQCIKKPLTPQKIAAAVAYLCSEDSDFLTGEIINIDGGRTMH